LVGVPPALWIPIAFEGMRASAGGRADRQTNRLGLHRCHLRNVLPSWPRLGIGGVHLWIDTYSHWLIVSRAMDALNLRNLSHFCHSAQEDYVTSSAAASLSRTDATSFLAESRHFRCPSATGCCRAASLANAMEGPLTHVGVFDGPPSARTRLFIR